jgi:hypothetical protein
LAAPAFSGVAVDALGFSAVFGEQQLVPAKPNGSRPHSLMVMREIPPGCASDHRRETEDLLIRAQRGSDRCELPLFISACACQPVFE